MEKNKCIWEKIVYRFFGRFFLDKKNCAQFLHDFILVRKNFQTFSQFSPNSKICLNDAVFNEIQTTIGRGPHKELKGSLCYKLK